MNDERFTAFRRDEWARLRAATPLTLDESDLATLRGINEDVALDEVVDVYLPLSRLLNLHVAAAQALHRVTDTFLGVPARKVPYIVAVAGSVAVGKSTTARILQALLSRWPDHPTVELVTTDGFLFPNRVLDARGLLGRKGFPESYDVRRLVQFLRDVKTGRSEVRAPMYSHVVYDVLDEEQVVRCPDIVIVEGLNLLQAPSAKELASTFVSEFLDFAIYVDADEAHIERWYVERFLALRESVFRDERSFFHHFSGLDDEQTAALAHDVWRSINGVNLRENILPTRERAHLVLEKGADHSVQRVRLRRTPYAGPR